MFQKILVPLDGSRLSEAALPPAVVLAARFKASVVLLHVIEQEAPSEIHKERHLTQVDEAEDYLKEAARQFFPAEIQVETHVHPAPVPDVPRSIVEHATAEFQPDLIVMCTHGRGGMRETLYGSIAQQVVAQGKIPLLLVKPSSSEFKLQKILLPLDPDSIHDESFPAAESLASAFQAELVLVSVVPTLSTVAGEKVAVSKFMPISTEAFFEIRERSALEHLEEHVRALHTLMIRASAEAVRGDPATAILEIGRKSGVDLLILSTHRKTGLNAFWALSVAPKVAQKTTIPLLLIPLP